MKISRQTPRQDAYVLNDLGSDDAVGRVFRQRVEITRTWTWYWIGPLNSIGFYLLKIMMAAAVVTFLLMSVVLVAHLTLSKGINCPATEIIRVQTPCRFCNLADTTVIDVKTEDNPIFHCSSPQIIIEPTEIDCGLTEEFGCENGLMNGSCFVVKVKFDGWHLGKETSPYNLMEYNARITRSLVFSCSDEDLTDLNPSTLGIWIDHRFFQSTQSTEDFGEFSWKRISTTSGFAVLP